ncbi:conserved hypothetical protein, partial [Trichinella spiralis]|uniref:hypothetical protein n=1 Tax=Trichinella spiralis TaxID=6334 RepID=UPI0001EFE0E9
ETGENPVITGEPKGEKKDSKKIKKKSKKRSKSKKTKRTEKDIAAKEAASSQIPETDITSPNLALASEVTATNVDQLDIVPPIAEETDKKPVITDIPKGEKKDSKKIKKKSKKLTMSIKDHKFEQYLVLNERATSQVTETDIHDRNLHWKLETPRRMYFDKTLCQQSLRKLLKKPLITGEPDGVRKKS